MIKEKKQLNVQPLNLRKKNRAISKLTNNLTKNLDTSNIIFKNLANIREKLELAKKRSNNLDFVLKNTNMTYNMLNKPVSKTMVSNDRVNNIFSKVLAEKPNIFDKKKNKDIKYIPLKRMKELSGLIKHFPSSAIEWHNSVYSYNNNYSKLLSTADKSLINMVKSYLFFRFKRTQRIKKLKKAISNNLYINKYRKWRTRPKLRQFKNKRISINHKILVTKGNVKHTSNLATITLFIFNRNKQNLSSKTKKGLDYLFFIWKKYHKPKQKKKSTRAMTYWRMHVKVRYRMRLILRRLGRKTRILKKKKFLFNLSTSLNINDIYSIRKYLIKKNSLMTYYYNRRIKDIRTVYKNKLAYKKKKYNPLWMQRKKLLMKVVQIKKFNRFFRFVLLNGNKFKKRFIENLRKFACKIYNKNVFFNIVSLNKYYLNSNIYTQLVTKKLKNRKFGLSNLLGRSLNNIKIPQVLKIKVKPDLTKLWINKINHNIVLDLITNYENNNVWLDKLFLKHNSLVNPLSLFAVNQLANEKKPTLKEFSVSLAKSTKNRTLAGIRVEVKGRLTRRFKASRSVYKLKWIGGLRNIDSSYKGLSAVILRGHDLSNVEYTVLASKRRIGAYGVKGSVSSM